MDSIICKGMNFKACHGVLPEEKECPQLFTVDVEMFLHLNKAGMTDNIEDTVDYAQVYQQIKDIVENEQFQLLEALAENIAASLLMHFPLAGVKVTVYKPQAPVMGDFSYFAVKIERFRK